MDRSDLVLAVHLDTAAVTMRFVEAGGGDLVILEGKGTLWDCKPYRDDSSGRRLFEEVGRRCTSLIRSTKLSPGQICIGLPGIVNQSEQLVRSSRLGVFEPINVAELFKSIGLPKTSLHRDVDCLCALSSSPAGVAANHPNFLFIYADEGIGSTITIEGKRYRGAGYAGPIGRLVVEPSGSFNPLFRTQGPLENYVGRSALSEAMVNLYIAEAGKLRDQESVAEGFRLALKTAADGDIRGLTYRLMNRGVSEQDPIALQVVDRAAHYFGLALSNVITVLNPPLIVLAGGLINGIPTFVPSTIEYARRYSWLQAWNSTEFKVESERVDGCALGAALMRTRR